MYFIVLILLLCLIVILKFKKYNQPLEKFNPTEKKRITLVMGYWYVNNNKKHDIAHYNKFIPKTFSSLKNFDIVFFYDDEEILKLVKDNLNLNLNNLKPIKKSVDKLPTYNYSNKLLELCKEQDNKELQSYNKGGEKGIVHCNRELKLSGDEAYRKIVTIWTSKLLLLNECIDNNYFNNNRIAWCDVSITRVNNHIANKCLFYDIDYKPNKIYTLTNLMKYYGKQLKLAAAYIYSDNNTMKQFIELYKKELYSINEKYCHDEETIINKIYEKQPQLFEIIYKK